MFTDLLFLCFAKIYEIQYFYPNRSDPTENEIKLEIEIAGLFLLYKGEVGCFVWFAVVVGKHIRPTTFS